MFTHINNVHGYFHKYIINIFTFENVSYITLKPILASSNKNQQKSIFRLLECYGWIVCLCNLRIVISQIKILLIILNVEKIQEYLYMKYYIGNIYFPIVK